MNNDVVNWVKAAQGGDRQAFDQLIQTYQRQAVSVAYRLLSNMDDALEVAQNALVKAYQAMDQLENPERFGPWLMRIVTNQSLNFRRSRSKQRHLSLSSQLESDDEQNESGLQHVIESKESSPIEALSAGELDGKIQQAMDELPENLRTALLLFSVEQLPQKEIADIMDCSVQTVKWNIFEARKRLKKLLQDWIEE